MSPLASSSILAATYPTPSPAANASAACVAKLSRNVSSAATCSSIAATSASLAAIMSACASICVCAAVADSPYSCASCSRYVARWLSMLAILSSAKPKDSRVDTHSSNCVLAEATADSYSLGESIRSSAALFICSHVVEIPDMVVLSKAIWLA